MTILNPILRTKKTTTITTITTTILMGFDTIEINLVEYIVVRFLKNIYEP